MITAVLLSTLIVLVLAFLYTKFLYRKRRCGEPPLVPGHFLWGNAKDFSVNATTFLHSVRKSFGNIFTIRLVNQHLTILMDPHSVEAMSRQKLFDFDPIQRQVNWNVFSFKLVDARAMLKETRRKVNGEYIAKGMGIFNSNLMESIDSLSLDANMNESEANGAWQTTPMRDVTSKTLFYSIHTTIFGKDPNSKFHPVEIHRSFDTFHKYFNYLWLGVSIKFFPKAVKALNVLADQPTADELLQRPDLSDYIRHSVEFMKSRNQTESDIVGHSLVYLHVNYNSFRLAYWCLYYIMQNIAAHEDLLAEIEQIVKDRQDDDDNTATFTTKDLEQNMPILDSIVKETIRMTSGVFVVRYISEDCDFTMSDGQTYTCRKGDRVAFYPPALHKDPEVFEKPSEFIYNRFVNATFYDGGKLLKSPVMGFGTLCPGKRYAIMQVKWFIIAMTHMFDYKLAEGESTTCDVRYHGHEILPPVNDVTMHLRRRNVGGPRLLLV